MIDIKKLTNEDKGKHVLYQPHPESDMEEGVITSWTARFIFVDYQGVGRGQATPPDKLEFKNR